VLKIKPEDKVIFATKEEALRAGYTPCRICLQ
jgi:methylphosphotriester-DNA--protein-cysteine methyltransferase